MSSIVFGRCPRLGDWGDLMRSAFRRNLHVTASFLLVRFVASVAVALMYIFVAAGIQYAFVELLGESTFNYIVGGLLSLMLGVLFCGVVGNLVFMFVRGWHVAALAYAKKIYARRVPAVSVGIRAFNANLISFGAVYGVRTIVRSVASDLKDSLWEILEDVPILSNLQSLAENPVVEHMAKSVVDYGFDATIFYLIRNKPEDASEVPGTIFEGLKRYLCCLPSILLTAIGTYCAFEAVPAILKALVIFITFMTNGICAGILITVLLVPLFYILDNTFFKPMTMMMFLTCFAAQCDKEPDEEDRITQIVNRLLNGEEGEDAEEDAEEGEQAEEEQPKPKKPSKSTEKPKEPSAEKEPAPESKKESEAPKAEPEEDPDILDFGEGDPTDGADGFDWGEPPIRPLTDTSPVERTSALQDMIQGMGTPAPRVHPVTPPKEEEHEDSPTGILGLGDAINSIDPSLLGGGFDDDEEGY